MLSRAAVEAVVVGTVKLVDQFPIFELGGALRHLSGLAGRETADPFDQIFALWAADNALAKVLDGDQPLKFCRGAAIELINDIREQQQRLNSTSEETKQFTPLPSWKLHSTKTKIEIFEHQLSAELKKTASYAVPPRGIFNIELLAENAERHIHESIRIHLSEFTIAEYRQAGRCLAFGQYSACGFHAARAVEDELRAYFKRFLGDPPEETMGQLAGKLSDLQKSKNDALKPRENTVRHIKDLTNFDRNPLMHRRVVLNEVDATTLFNNALSVIGEMVKELLELDDSDRQDSLPLSAGSVALIGSDAPKPKKARASVNALRIPDGSQASS